MKRSGSANLAVAVAVGCCAAAIVYSVSRAIQFFFFPAPDPRTVMVVTRIAFFWRAQIAVYGAVLAALGAAAMRERVAERFDAWLPRIVVVTVLITTLQGVFAP